LTAGLVEALSSGQPRIYDLAQPLRPGIPSSPNHPGFHFALTRRHGDMVREDGASAASELIVMGGHTGTHVDALAHVSHDGMLSGGVSVADAMVEGRFACHGIDTLAPLVVRGVLLDVAGTRGVPVLDADTAIGPDDLRQAAAWGGVELRAGDVALIRTGWARNWTDPVGFLGHGSGVPGPSVEGARWLVNHDVRLTGSDTTAFEHIPPNAGHRLLPVHRVLLVEAGVPIVEMLNLEELATAGVREFVFVLAPLPIVGGTGSPVRPLALVDST
jgi:kynurenine formamidase